MRRLDSRNPCLGPSPGKGHWEKQNDRACERCLPVEDDVSKLLREKFCFRVVKMDDMAYRNLMERKLISALSSCLQCHPSDKWLGHFTYSEKVRRSGMWNSDYVNETCIITREEWDEFLVAVTETMNYRTQ